jgi:hypothetical protein
MFLRRDGKLFFHFVWQSSQTENGICELEEIPFESVQEAKDDSKMYQKKAAVKKIAFTFSKLMMGNLSNLSFVILLRMFRHNDVALQSRNVWHGLMEAIVRK